MLTHVHVRVRVECACVRTCEDRRHTRTDVEGRCGYCWCVCVRVCARNVCGWVIARGSMFIETVNNKSRGAPAQTGVARDTTAGGRG